jgi:hypothetical protein
VHIVSATVNHKPKPLPPRDEDAAAAAIHAAFASRQMHDGTRYVIT